MYAISPLTQQFPNITDDNFILYAAKAYSAPTLMQSEFEEDIQRIVYIKRLINKFRVLGILKERLLLNHLIVLGNVFGIEATNRLLFSRLEEKDREIIKPFLMVLNYLPSVVVGINGQDINTSDIQINQMVVELLEKSIGA